MQKLQIGLILQQIALQLDAVLNNNAPVLMQFVVLLLGEASLIESGSSPKHPRQIVAEILVPYDQSIEADSLLLMVVVPQFNREYPLVEPGSQQIIISLMAGF